MGERSDPPDAAPPFERLRAKHSKEWPAIASARELTARRFRELEPLGRLTSDNTALVVFGSFARSEMTPGSDVDWSLLIDGPSDPEHFRVAQEVRRFLTGLQLAEPGTTETFGTLASSHELIHHIGGVRDTNQNMTRRILLLLESRAVTNQLVLDRVIRGILNRYIVAEVSVSWRTEPTVVVPRFLLNDIVRFWRTMAVDYAAKRWEQSDKKWALRNAKLRMSRKLLFVAGLLICFNFELNPPGDRDSIVSDFATLPLQLTDYLLKQMRLTPIDLLSQALLKTGRPDVVADIMDSYDDFLGLLADETERRRLEDLKFEAAGEDELFGRIRALSRSFQRGLTGLFFYGDDTLRELVTKYGVF
ncbi:MAG TPA: nucleotidyltransferase domain-containing protein [Thermoanaerobaculia bacterium]|jgi:predicted nucleotidyltransferase|nr:nucleotidyltransferase domain-containing protein [Thermoanaerobaculia bacterium]